MSSMPTMLGGPQGRILPWPYLSDRPSHANVPPNLYVANSFNYNRVPSENMLRGGTNPVYGGSYPYPDVHFRHYNLGPPMSSSSSQQCRYSSEEEPKYLNTPFDQNVPHSVDLSLCETSTFTTPDPTSTMLTYNMDLLRHNSVPSYMSSSSSASYLSSSSASYLSSSSASYLSSSSGGGDSRYPFDNIDPEPSYTRRATEPTLSPMGMGFSNGSAASIEKFECPVCSKSFTKRHSLKLHMKSHSGEKPFKCSQCDKTFARCHDRKRHEHLHKGIKVFRCEGYLRDGKLKWGCGKTFARSDALTRHLRTGAGCRCLKPLIDETKFLYGEAIIPYARQTTSLAPPVLFPGGNIACSR